MLRFVNNCQADKREEPCSTGALTSTELFMAEGLWISFTQWAVFPDDVRALRMSNEVSGGPLSALHPFLDANGLLRMGRRLAHSSEPYSTRHPLIIPGKHTLTKLTIRTEHCRLLHAGPTLVAVSLAQRFAIIGASKVIHDVTHTCIKCQCVSS